MDGVEPSRRPCPFCGGEIQAAAILCRHCKRRFDGSETTASSLPTRASPSTAALAPSVAALIDFLVARKVADRARLESVGRAAGSSDARVVIGHCQAASLIAPAQTESLSVAYRDAQSETLRTLLGSAFARGWLTSEHAHSAMQAYAAAVFTRSPQEFVVDQGLMTERQASELVPAGVMARLGAAIAPAAAPALNRMSSRSVAIGAGIVALVGLAAAYWAFSKSPPIVPDCTMNGNGIGTCRFTNVTSTTANSACGRIVVTCRHMVPAETRTGAMICSGEVEPSATTSVGFTVVGMDQLLPVMGDWRDSCSFEWSPNHD